MAGGGEERQGTLKKALERELSLDPRDLRSHAWYHGPIPRQRAEEVLINPGEFLVRDCVSQPGDYVLTCRGPSGPLHFVINKVVTQRDTVYQRIQYRFEDEPFETVPDLITFYVGSGKPVSSASQARIKSPCVRSYPLSFYAAKYGVGGVQTPTGVGYPPRLPVKKQRSLSVAPCDDRSCSADGVITPGRSGAVAATKFSTHSLPRGQPRHRGMTRGTSDSALSPTLERRPPHDPPPKPSLVRSMSKESSIVLETFIDDDLSLSSHYQSRVQTTGSDSGNGSGDSAQSSAAGDDSAVPCTILTQRAPGVILKPAPMLRLSADSGYDSAVDEPPPPRVIIPTRFNIDEFSSLLLPTTENKALDETILRDIKVRLLETGPRILANHLTRVDVELTLAADPVAFSDQELGITIPSGLELINLPFGSQLRRDLIERTECIKMMVAVTILTCNLETERAEILNKWIQIAVETKTALGNLYGFSSIIMALCMPQISRLTVTWHTLRQKFTESAFNFESKLRSVLKCMNECKNPQAPNTCIPHILPYLVLMEKPQQHILDYGERCLHNVEASSFSSWDSSPPNFGLATLHGHLQAARDFSAGVNAFRRQAEIVLADSKTDDLLLDIFRTELHLKVLWGSRGAGVESLERHEKFLKVLSVLSEKVEPSTPTHQHHPPDPAFGTSTYNRIIGTSV